jgi:hypothetical protein
VFFSSVKSLERKGFIPRRDFKMVIRCIISGSMESIKYSAKKCRELPSLPGHIARKGPYVKNEEEGDHQIVISYEFDRSRLKEAWENVLRQMDSFHGVAGLNISIHLSEKTRKVNQSRELHEASAPVGMIDLGTSVY